MKRRYSWPLGPAGCSWCWLPCTRPALPGAQLLNDKLADMGDYRGQITDVTWRLAGAYRINGLKIVKVDGKVPVPFVKAPLIDLSVSWHSLWYDHAVVPKCSSSSPK